MSGSQMSDDSGMSDEPTGAVFSDATRCRATARR